MMMGFVSFLIAGALVSSLEPTFPILSIYRVNYYQNLTIG